MFPLQAFFVLALYFSMMGFDDQKLSFNKSIFLSGNTLLS